MFYYKNHKALLKSFNHIISSSRTPLFNPESSLSWVLNQAAIKAANEERFSAVIGTYNRNIDKRLLHSGYTRLHTTVKVFLQILIRWLTTKVCSLEYFVLYGTRALKTEHETAMIACGLALLDGYFSFTFGRERSSDLTITAQDGQ